MRSLAISLLVLVTVPFAMAKDKMQIGDLLKQHLDSIGSEQARAAVKTRVAEGALNFRLVSSGVQPQDGKQVFVSEGNKLACLLKLPNPNYHGERFVSDGKKTMAADMRPGTYSEFGQFMRMHDEIFTEGLWGGVLSTGWALAHLDEHHAKLKYNGLKKVDGRELHEVRYTPGKRSDLEIRLYFEPEKFRHVLTVYALTISPQIGTSDQATARQQETHYRLEEHFSDFKKVDDLMLPTQWTVEFMPDVPEQTIGGNPIIGASRNLVSRYDVTETKITDNLTLDPRNFEVK